MRRLVAPALLLAATPVLAQSGTGNQVLGGLGETGQKAGFGVQDAATAVPDATFEVFLGTYAVGFFGAFALLYVILLVFAGYKWMTAQGNDEVIKEATSMILNSTIAMGVLLAVGIIARFVLVYFGQATGN